MGLQLTGQLHRLLGELLLDLYQSKLKRQYVGFGERKTLPFERKNSDQKFRNCSRKEKRRRKFRIISGAYYIHAKQKIGAEHAKITKTHSKIYGSRNGQWHLFFSTREINSSSPFTFSLTPIFQYSFLIFVADKI